MEAINAVSEAAQQVGGEAAASTFNTNDKYIGLALAISSSVAIGTSFIITKKGLISAADSHDGFSSESYSYLKNGLWWAGMLTMVVGEVANFAAYTYAPPILVTPLGALSVLIGFVLHPFLLDFAGKAIVSQAAILAAFFLGERLGKIGISGCSLCLVGSIVIVLHAPEDKEIATVDEMLEYALQPGFMAYCLFVLVFSLYMIYKVAPKYGATNPLVHISICSLVGSISVMAVKALGIALKLTFAGNNQLWRAGTWIFAITVAGCIATQMAHFNKALDLFPTTVVNTSYYVMFTTSTLLASVILFHGLNTAGGAQTFSLLCGLYIISMGVYLLNLSRAENEGISDRSLRQSLGGGGGGGGRQSYSGGRLLSNRLSLTSDSDGHERGADARHSTGLYRVGGAVVGGVQPLFDYDRATEGKIQVGAGGGGGEHMRMDQFALRNDDDDDDDDDEMDDEVHVKVHRPNGGNGSEGLYRH